MGNTDNGAGSSSCDKRSGVKNMSLVFVQSEIGTNH